MASSRPALPLGTDEVLGSRGHVAVTRCVDRLDGADGGHAGARLAVGRPCAHDVRTTRATGTVEATMRIRQIALVARDLEATTSHLEAVLGIEIAYRDPGVTVFGLSNAVMPVGDCFLEVVSPIDDSSSARRFLDRAGGDCGYMVIVQTADLASDRRRMAAIGVRIVWEIAFPDIETIHLHPRDVGGAIVSLDEARPPHTWRWAGPDWERHVRTELASGLAAAELAAENPGALATRWSRVLDRPITLEGQQVPTIALEGGSIRFVADADAGDGRLTGIDVISPDPARLLAAAVERGLVVEDGAARIGGVCFRPCRRS
jgi:hypothetical protein